MSIDGVFLNIVYPANVAGSLCKEAFCSWKSADVLGDQTDHPLVSDLKKSNSVISLNGMHFVKVAGWLLQRKLFLVENQRFAEVKGML